MREAKRGAEKQSDMHQPHGPQSQLVCQVSIVGQQGREQVFGKGVHGDAFPVDDFSQAAEGTT